MERRIPDVWDIFSLSHGTWSDLESSRRKYDSNGIHVNWSPHSKNAQMLMQWCDRSSNCDRPRTYDKFYRKGPSNYHDPSSRDSMGCSSDTEEALDFPVPAVGDGTSSQRCVRRRRKKCATKSSGLQYSRTITESDVRTIERHLSMKKTIRKKIMRDLQQAFVGDPNEFQGPPEAVPPDQRSKINLNNLKFDPKLKDPKFLDLLRAPETSQDQGSKAAAVISRLTGRVKLASQSVKSPSLNLREDTSLEAEFQRRVTLNSDCQESRRNESLWSSKGHRDWPPDMMAASVTSATLPQPDIDGKIIQTKSELRKKKRKRKPVDENETKTKKSVWSIFSRK